MDDASFRGDCARCIGLCCVALSFDRGAQFAFDKPAGEDCRHLAADRRCAIHDRLAAEGMAGCARYDCAGAGQWTTALFQGLDWRHAAVRRQLFRAFGLVRDIQHLRLAFRRLGGRAEGLERAAAWRLSTLLAEGPAAIATARSALARLASGQRRTGP